MARKSEEVAEKVAMPVYSYEELVDGYKRFGVPKECVMTALRMYKNVSLSVDDAKKIINNFMSKKVI